MECPTTRMLERAEGVSTALALLTCYGTLIVVSLLPLIGVSVAIHEGMWAGAISLFSVLAAGDSRSTAAAIGPRLRLPWPRSAPR